MRHVNTLIIGGGQAGLAMSRALTDRSIEHLVLERGQAGERWRSQRWDSLKLLTPNWMTRLPGYTYRGNNPHGYMSRHEVTRFLEDYATENAVPLKTGVLVTTLERFGNGYRVLTNAGTWTADNVVLATGYCDATRVPSLAARLHPSIRQVTPCEYKNPSQLSSGGVLVVGASATGAQLAEELVRSGRKVTLAVGRHIRLPRRYRGRDILAWFDETGIFSQGTAEMRDLASSRRQPSLQLVGSTPYRDIDLGYLQSLGIRLTGHLQQIESRVVAFAQDLEEHLAHADQRMHRLLDTIDEYIARRQMDTLFPVEPRPAAIVPKTSPTVLNLEREGIETVLWATGYRRNYSWLKVPILNTQGELIHRGGVTPARGLYALGLNFMRRRNSSFIDGVGHDACELAEHIVHNNQHHAATVTSNTCC